MTYQEIDTVNDWLDAAEEAGDSEMADLCLAALAGDEKALAEVMALYIPEGDE